MRKKIAITIVLILLSILLLYMLMPQTFSAVHKFIMISHLKHEIVLGEYDIPCDNGVEIKTEEGLERIITYVQNSTIEDITYVSLKPSSGPNIYLGNHNIGCYNMCWYSVLGLRGYAFWFTTEDANEMYQYLNQILQDS